ncbi:MAG: MATE family efflux transporter, partial [Acidaminococcaceae bacterium]
MEQFIKEENILGTEPVSKLLKMFAWPAIISMLANSLYNIIDQIFIGQAVGYLGNAATTVAFPIATIVLSLGTLLGVGSSAFAAIKLGEGNELAAEKALNTTTLVSVVSGVVLAVGGLMFLEPLLTFFGATANTMTYSKEFGGIIIAITPLTILLVSLSNMARADGSPQLSMHALVGGVLVNVVLAPLFIFVFHWGVWGAALATAFAQVFTVSILLWYFLQQGKMRLRRELFWTPDWNICRSFMAIGASSCLVQLGATVLQIIMNHSLLYYGDLSQVGGDLALSAMGIVMKINMIIISICIGIGIGAQPIIGFNRGANNPSRILETYKYAVGIATAITTLGWLCFMVLPEPILRIFGSNGEEFMAFGVLCMRVFLGGVFAAGFQLISTSYFQATGQPLKASILSLLRQMILLVPLILLLPLWFGLMGILYAGVVADLVAAVLVLFFMRSEMKKLHAECLAK